MLNKPVYIHYGSNVFHTPKPIMNCMPCPFTKPSGGLWASRKDGEETWKDWCEAEKFRLDSFDKYFEFTLKDDARVLTLSERENLDDLPMLFGEESPVRDPYRTVYLDFEKLMETYDAVEVTDIGLLYFALYGWDCNSILVMNPDIVEVIDKEDL